MKKKNKTQRLLYLSLSFTASPSFPFWFCLHITLYHISFLLCSNNTLRMSAVVKGRSFVWVLCYTLEKKNYFPLAQFSRAQKYLVNLIFNFSVEISGYYLVYRKQSFKNISKLITDIIFFPGIFENKRGVESCFYVIKFVLCLNLPVLSKLEVLIKNDLASTTSNYYEKSP